MSFSDKNSRKWVVSINWEKTVGELSKKLYSYVYINSWRINLSHLIVCLFSSHIYGESTSHLIIHL